MQQLFRTGVSFLRNAVSKNGGKLAIAATMFIVSGFFINSASAADTGFLSPSANTIGGSGVGSSWATPANAYASDDVWATVSATNKWASYANFNIPTIPAGCVVTGIEVSVEGKTTGRDVAIDLSWDGSTYTASQLAGFSSGTIDIVKTIGGASNNWGRSWASSEFNNTNFRVRVTSQSLSGTAFSLDHVKVKVYFSDVEASVITSHPTVIATADRLGFSLVTYVTPTTTDNIDPAGVATCLPASGSVFPIGNTTVTCNAADVAGNHATPTTFTVTVTPAAVSASASTVALSNSFINTTGGVTTLTLTVKDQYGNPISGITPNKVAIEVSGINNTVTPQTTATNADGIFTATLQSTTAQSKTIKITVDGVVLSHQPSVDFYSSDPVKAVIVATPNPQEASLAGADVSLRIFVADGYNTAVPDGNEIWVAPSTTAPIGIPTTDCTQSNKKLTSSGYVTCNLHFSYKGAVALKVYGKQILTGSGDVIVNFNDTTIPEITISGVTPAEVEYRTAYTDGGATASDNIDSDISDHIISSTDGLDTSVINLSAPFTDKIVATYHVYYNVADSSGNNAVQKVRTVNVKDTTAPIITSLTSDATTGKLMKIGDVIHFTLTPNTTEPVATVAGSYNGQTLVWATADSGVTYTATYTVVEGDATQTAPLQLTGVIMTDEAGNASAPFDGSDITNTIDATRPIITSVHLESDNANKTLAKVGDTVTLTFTASEPITTPTVAIAGNAVTPVVSGGNSYTATYTMQSADIAGGVSIDIKDLSDIAGNSGTEVTGATDSSSVTFDKVAPTATVAQSGTAAGGTITYTFSEPIQLISQADGKVTPLSNSLLGIYNLVAYLAHLTGDPAPATTGSITSASLSGNVLTITYTGSLIKNADATYLVDAWGYDITDLTGNNIVQDPTTQAFVVTGDTTKPTATVIESGTAAGGTITYTFSEPVQLINQADGTVTALDKSLLGIYQIVGADYSAKADKVEIANATLINNVLTITYTGSLIRNANATYLVDAWGYSITDIVGNRIAQDPTTQTFTVIGDTTKPTVTALTHDGAAKTITYTFSEPVQLINQGDGTVTALDKSLLGIYDFATYMAHLPGEGAPAATANIINATLANNVLTITYTGSLIKNADKTYLVDAWGYSITDMVGNRIAQDTGSQTFEVIGDTTFPTVTEIEISDDLVKSGDVLTVEVEFSEDMAVSPAPTITISGSNILTATAMTRVDATHYTYGYAVEAGDGIATIAIADGNDLVTNLLVASSTTVYIDNTLPIIDQHDAITEVAGTTGGKIVTYTVTANDDHDGVVTAICTPASGTFFDVSKTTTVTCNVADQTGNNAVAMSFDVTINPGAITKLTVSATSPKTTVETSVVSVYGRDQYNNITTNQSGTTVVVYADNGGGVDDSILTLVNGQATTNLKKSTAGVTRVTVSSGSLLPGTFAVTFTPADISGPSVLTMSPANGATNVAISAPIFFNFSEALNADTANGTNIQLMKVGVESADTQIAGMVLIEGNQKVYFMPAANLDYSSSYYFVVSGVADKAGNVMTAGIDASNSGFTTEANSAHLGAPTVAGQSPLASAVDVALDAHPFVDFSEAMKATTMSTANIELRKVSDNSVVPASVSVENGGTRAVINPTSNLELETAYYIYVSGDVADEFGNIMGSPYSSGNFTTIADNTTLVITGISTVKSSATADNSWANGWSWQFDVTAPTDETNLKMKFADFVSGSNVIPAASNIRFYSAQSSNANSGDNAIVIDSANTYSAGTMLLNGDDNLDVLGRQIKIIVEVRVPEGTAGGSYSTGYGVETTPNEL